jgi:hypothetical protein
LGFVNNLNGYNLENGNKKSPHRTAYPVVDAKVEECAGCGDKNPEYVLEDRRLCFDCYRAEKYYWAKSLDTHL